jgi:hypothetical protein
VLHGSSNVPFDRFVLVQFGRLTGIEWRLGGEAIMPDGHRLAAGIVGDPDDPRGTFLPGRDWIIKNLTDVPKPEDAYSTDFDDHHRPRRSASRCPREFAGLTRLSGLVEVIA